MKTLPLDYLLATRQARAGKDQFAGRVTLGLAVGWMVLVALGAYGAGRLDAEVMLAMGWFCLFIATFTLGLGLPFREIQRGAALHASLHSGRCYQEILGTLIRPGEILDQIAYHCTRTFLLASAPWALGYALMWAVLSREPAHVLILCGSWLVGSSLFVWSTSYLAQQFTIVNSQFKGGFITSVGETAVGLAVSTPSCVCFLVSLVALMMNNIPVFWVGFLAYVGVTAALSRWVAAAAIEKLPHLCEKVSQLGRSWFRGRNRWVFNWSSNPIVVRERQRDSGRIPGGLLGALILQGPLACLTLVGFSMLLPAVAQSRHGDDYVLTYSLMGLVGMIQLSRACRRSCGAIVGEVEKQTLESMQNTQLQAREYIRGWLEVAAVPLTLENLAILLCLCLLSPPSLVATANFLFLPWLGAAVGLASSCELRREAAVKRYSETTAGSLVGFGVICGAISWYWPHWQAPWGGLFLTYCLVVFALSIRNLLSRIQIGKARPD